MSDATRALAGEPVRVWVGAIGVGLAAAYGAVAFRLAIGLVQQGFYGFPDERVHSLAAHLPWWQLLLAPAAGGLLVAALLQIFMPDRRPQSIPHVIEAAAVHDGQMTWREGIGAAVISAASLGVGASAGREGPVVHLGAALASGLARWLRLGRPGVMTLFGCGIASATAASFNTPMAGVFFALEVVIGLQSLGAFGPVLMASVIGTVVCRIHIGDFPAFTVPDYGVASFWELPVFAVLGAVSAGVAMLFMWSLFAVEDGSVRLAARARLWDWVRLPLGGLAVGAIAVFLPEVLGVGYEATDAALQGELALGLLLALIAAKIAATAISLGSGFGGGIFSPALYIGAMTGGAFGLIAQMLLPSPIASHALYATVGMGAVTAATLGAPITTSIIVFELTGDYRITIAVMVAVAVAVLLTRQTLGRTVFDWQLARRGVNPADGREHRLLRAQRVRDLVSERFQTLPADSGADDVRRAVLGARFGGFLVIDSDGRLVAAAALAQLNGFLTAAESAPALRLVDSLRPPPDVLELEDDLDSALRVFHATAADWIAVVDHRETMRPVGILHHKDVVFAHNRALLQVRAEDRGELSRR